MKSASEYVSVNGEMVRADEACISIYDRGLRFGDGVFETIAVAYGVPYCWDLHQQRLFAGCDALRIPYKSAELRAHCDALIQKNNVVNGMLRIMVTRGVGSQGYLPVGSASPTVIIEATAVKQGCAEHKNDLSLWVSSYKRLHPDTLPTQAKLMQGVNATLARMEAQDADCDEALMLDVNHHISEAASGNLLWMREGKYYTAHTDSGCLSGTMLAQLALLLTAPVQPTLLPLEELQHIDALVMTNAIKGAVAVRIVRSNEIEYHFDKSVTLAAHCNGLIQKDIARQCKGS